MNENSDYNLYATDTPKRFFTISECFFAWLCLIGGYVFWRFLPVDRAPLGGFLLVVITFISTAIISRIKGAVLRPLPVIIGISAIIVSTTLIICSNTFLYFFAYCYALAAYCYFIYAVNGNSTKSGFNDLILVDFIKSLFILPFCSFGYLFKAIFTGRGKGNGKNFLKIILGIAIALIPTGIVIYLLSYDNNFRELLKNIFNFRFIDFFTFTVRLTLAIPTAMYVYGLFISASEHKCSNVLTEDTCSRICSKVKFLPAATTLTAVIPLLAVYVLFFISQLDYYISGFTGVLPDGLSYADYAKEGFFQLCTVSVINLIVIIIASIFMQQKDAFGKKLLKAISIAYSIVTLILISTALSKMFMYISYYGLTQKRVYSTWLMAVIAIIFVLLIIRQFVPAFKIVACSLTVCVVMFAGLTVANTDSLIAKYNVNCYLDGTLDEVDIDALLKLGDSSVPELVNLAKELESRIDKNTADKEEQSVYEELILNLSRLSYHYKDENKEFYSYTIPYIRAQKSLKSLDLPE